MALLPLYKTYLFEDISFCYKEGQEPNLTLDQK